MTKSIPKVNLHPASCKYLKLGHPWITDDSYTKKFPKDALFLIGVDEKNRQDVALLVNDPFHKTVKARLWSLDKAEWTLDFKDVLAKRIKTAIDIRRPLTSERENIFLINGESDGLPGLIVQQLKNELMIQYYAMFWKAQEPDLIFFLKENLPENISYGEIRLVVASKEVN